MRIRGYDATREADGTLVVHDVPIFLECERNGIEFDAAWIERALERAKLAEADGYFPPLHVRHHELSDDVRPAGFFRIKRAERVTFKGTVKLAIFADLVLTDPSAREEVLSKRLPYRSVEIYDVDNPGIDSLALLDHEAPYLELPMLAVATILDSAASATGVASATFANPWLSNRIAPGERLVALFQRGRSAHFLTQDATMDEDEENKDDAEMSADGESAGGGFDIEALVEAIASGSISVADMQLIVAAVERQQAASEPAESEESSEPASAPAPGSAMRRQSSAALLGRIDALEARIAARDALDKCTRDVAVALKKLGNRPLGSDIESKLSKFHRTHGAAAFGEYVDALHANTAPVEPMSFATDSRAQAFLQQSGGSAAPASKTISRYQTLGVDAIQKAAQFSREWASLRSAGGTRLSEARYVDINMSKLGFALEEKVNG